MYNSRPFHPPPTVHIFHIKYFRAKKLFNKLKNGESKYHKKKIPVIELPGIRPKKTKNIARTENFSISLTF